MCGLTFELTPTAEVGTVRLVRDDASRAADQPYSACRSGSALNEVLGHTEVRSIFGMVVMLPEPSQAEKGDEPGGP